MINGGLVAPLRSFKVNKSFHTASKNNVKINKLNQAVSK